MSDILVPIIAVLLSSATSLVLVGINYKRDLKLEISRKRYELYIEIYELVDDAIREPKLLFDTTYLRKIEIYNAKMKLIASNSVNDEFFKFIELINNSVKEYENFCFEEDPLKGLEEENCFSVDPELVEEFQNRKNNYAINNAMESQSVREYIFKLVKEMRKDIGIIYKDRKIKKLRILH